MEVVLVPCCGSKCVPTAISGVVNIRCPLISFVARGDFSYRVAK